MSLAVLLTMGAAPALGAGGFDFTSSPDFGRFSHTATLLEDGKVLVAGGYAEQVGGAAITSSTERYDPGPGTWDNVDPLDTPRMNHTATLLENGKVLVVGGFNDHGRPASSEIYDPATSTWSPAAPIDGAREGHTAALLDDGRVLVAGGLPNSHGQIYDPATDTWSAADSLDAGRWGHTATLLENGKVLVAGGGAGPEIYDPATDTWSAAGSPGIGNHRLTATLLEDGRVLAVEMGSAKIYDPATNTWSAAASPGTAREAHTATLLENGKVLIAGGEIPNPTWDRNSPYSFNSAEIYDPATDTWSATGSLRHHRSFHTAIPLENGKVLIAAGHDEGGTVTYGFNQHAELYRPAATVTASGSTITFQAGKEESNSLTVTHTSPDEYTFTDAGTRPGPLSVPVVDDEAGALCDQAAYNSVTCTIPDLSEINVNLGDMGDSLDASSLPENVNALVNAGAGNDTLNGGLADDLLDGEDGNDRIVGKGGDDSVFGGDGGDRISPGPGHDLVQAEHGNDRVAGGGGHDGLHTGPGNDSIEGGGGVDEITGDAGRDAIVGGLGPDDLEGGDGNDRIVAAGDGGRVDAVQCGAGDDEAVADAADLARGPQDCETITRAP